MIGDGSLRNGCAGDSARGDEGDEIEIGSGLHVVIEGGRMLVDN